MWSAKKRSKSTEEDRIKRDVLKSKFEEYVNPRKNTVFERYRALTICMENPEIPWRIQMERFIPVEIFRKKVIPFEVLPFSRFYRNDRNFLYHLFGLLVPGFMSRESEKFTGIL